MLKASDIMKKDVVTVSPEMSVEELGRLFIEKDISGAPVVDAAGKLLGVVTENDLISRNKRLHIPTVLRLFDAFIPLEGMGHMKKEVEKMAATTVGDICTKVVKALSPDTPLDEIATIMAEKGLHHLPVVSGGRVVGFVGKHEVIKGVAG